MKVHKLTVNGLIVSQSVSERHVSATKKILKIISKPERAPKRTKRATTMGYIGPSKKAFIFVLSKMLESRVFTCRLRHDLKGFLEDLVIREFLAARDYSVHVKLLYSVVNEFDAFCELI